MGMQTRTRLPAAVVTGALLALAACSGGNGTVTLHGTFADSADTMQGMACSDEGTLSGAAVAVTVDNVAAGSAPVSWQGNAANIGTTLGGDAVYGCRGTWSVSVPAAHIGYKLSVTGLGGVSGSVTLPVKDAGSAVALDDNVRDVNGNGVLELSQ